jgi:hypothetical protein
MKIRTHNALTAFMALLFFTACSKNDDVISKGKLAEPEKRLLSVALNDGRTYIVLNGVSQSKRVSTPQSPYANKFTIITSPDEAYLKSTTSISLEKPNDFSIISCIADKHLKLSFVDSLRKMPGYPHGWTALWNTRPSVEHESPTVLYTRQRNHLTIILSKYVEVFGFELAPNLNSSYEFIAGFYDSKQNPPLASVVQVATTPSGAKLFAIKSEKPFNVIEISFLGNQETENHPFGFAIANLRYKLCKETK